MADSDSGTHVTDISENFQDNFEPRKEGTRNIYFHSDHGILNLPLSILCPVSKYSLVKTILILPRN